MPSKRSDPRRRTQQRAAIRQVFEDVENPLGASEILEEARQHVPSLNQATVYRNLSRLVEEGWLRRVLYQPLGTLYERAGKPHHHHFHCHRCDRLLELEGCSVNLRRVAPAGFTVDGHELFVSGLCDLCNVARRPGT